MTTRLAGEILIGAAGAIGWFTVYRYPFRRQARRTAIGMRVGRVLGWNARVGFTAFATLWYLFFGVVAVFVVAHGENLGIERIFRLPGVGPALESLPLAMLGAVALLGASMGVVQAVQPDCDIPTAVGEVRWVKDSLELPSSWRWLVPLAGAIVEELFFRGVIFQGLSMDGAGFATSCVASTVLFGATQMAMTETMTAASILGISSLIIAIFGCLLVAGTGSVIPAVALHGAFAAFYSTSTWTLSTSTVVRTSSQ